MIPKIKLTTMTFPQICGLAALGFAFLIVFGNVILVQAGYPVGAEASEVIAFFSTHKALIGIVATLLPLIWILATLFGAGAVSVLWRSERDRGEAWSLIGFAGLILQNATMTTVIALRLALAATAAHDTTAAAELWALHNMLFTFNDIFLALALIGLSISGLHAGLIHQWHGGLGLLSAALLFSTATLNPLIIDPASPLSLLGLVGWLLWVVWVAIYGITLIRGGTVPVEFQPHAPSSKP
jgi:hypothetical protein